MYPYGVVLSKDGSTAYVSNWGEQSVTVIDTASATVLDTIAVGTHPSAMVLSPDGSTLYVANSDSDTISVIETDGDRVAGTIDLAPFAGARVGASPNALAIAPDGQTLYVANAGDNDVAVVRLAASDDEDSGANAGHVAGLLPTGWYPTGIALAPDGGTLYVANAKGLGAGPNPGNPGPIKDVTPPDQYVGSMMKATLSVIPVPGGHALHEATEQVQANDRFHAQRSALKGTGGDWLPKLPDGSPAIKHVIYVIKENRTYDQVLGDLGRGNGDPSLTLFGQKVTPNQHALAQRFVTLDNFYADSEVSADGWNWSTAAYANTYVQKSWPADYSDRNRGYDFEGGLNTAIEPQPNVKNARIWTRVDRAGLTYRNYGFWTTGTVPAVLAPNQAALAAHTDTQFPGFNMKITDQSRLDEWLKEFNGYVQQGNLPAVQFVRLPRDHTDGTTPGSNTPAAMVADNDLALGRLVDAVSHSPYWASTAIFVVEDDAQDGPDHVDAHRTTAQVISPYTQTGKVDSTFYSTVSMLRTMELILGLKPMTQFDAAAIPMSNAFSATPSTAPYTAITPTQSLTDVNTTKSPMAKESASWDFKVEDRAPMIGLNVAIWKSVRGVHSRMPAPRHGRFALTRHD
jgi:YVTN family beta-propeller protein